MQKKLYLVFPANIPINVLIDVNRNDDSGSPCIIPLVIWNNTGGGPFTRIEKKVDEMQSLIQLIKLSTNLIPSSVCFSPYHSIVSKALAMSSVYLHTGLRNSKPRGSCCQVYRLLQILTGFLILFQVRPKGKSACEDLKYNFIGFVAAWNLQLLRAYFPGGPSL